MRGCKYQIGKQFGDYTISEIDGQDAIVNCKCGHSRKIRKDSLRRMNTDCHCELLKDVEPGTVFNKLTVIKKTRRIKKVQHYLFRCECGVEKEQDMVCVKRGAIKSCGCSRYGFDIDKIDEIIGAYNSGMGLKEIQKEYNTSIVAIKKILKRKDVYIRTKSESHDRIAVNEYAFAKLNEESLYWAGFLAADGGVSETAIKLEIHDKDVDHLYKFKSFLSSEHLVKKRKSRDTSVLRFCSKRMVSDLSTLNIKERKSYHFDPTEECYTSSDFWRGMVDGDGWVYNIKNSLNVGMCGTIQCVTKFKEWGLKTSGFDAKVVKSGTVFRANFYGASAKKLLECMYSTKPRYFLRRKADVAEYFLGYKILGHV